MFLRESVESGFRHDITGPDHPILTVMIKEGETEREEFLLENRLPSTVDDEEAHKHYQKLDVNGESKYDGDEMLRRYRFSVIVNKLTETLYRRRYDMDKGGEFRKQVQVCNTATEESTENALRSDEVEVLKAYGNAEHAMREALTHASGVASFCFFNSLQPIDHFKFDIH